jgi:hypothetical protein
MTETESYDRLGCGTLVFIYSPLLRYNLMSTPLSLSLSLSLSPCRLSWLSLQYYGPSVLKLSPFRNSLLACT